MRARTYRILIWLYPRRFRREYGSAMTQLYTDLERDRAPHAFRRALAELALTIPYQYWEALMATTPMTRTAITVVFTAVIAITSMVLGASIVGLLLLLLLAWELYAVLRVRGSNGGRSRRTWWQLLLAGVGVFGVIFVVFALPWPESWRSEVPGEVAFFCVMIGISLSIVLVATGLFMGISRLAMRRRSA